MAMTWLTTGVDTFTFPGSAANLGMPQLTIPANGRLVRWQLRNIAIGFLQSGGNQTNLGIWYHSTQLHAVSGPYAGRNIWNAHRKVGYTPVVFRDPVTVSTTYTGFASDGDFEQGIDQKVSYGGAGKGAQVWQLFHSLVMHTSAMSATITNFHYSAQLAMLYEL